MRLLPQRVRRNQRGQSATVEMALIFPIFVLFMMGTIECSRAFFAYTTVSNAAREGARYGILHPYWVDSSDNDDPNNIDARAKQVTTGLRANDLTITVAFPDTSRSKGDRVKVTAAYSFTTIVPVIRGLRIASSTFMRIE